MSGAVYVLNSRGEVLEGWPQMAAGAIIASPIVLDVDGDDLLDVVVTSRDNWLYAWSASGELIEGVTVKSGDWIESTPAAGDIDGDGQIELVYASYDRSLSVLELVSDATAENLAWPSFRGDRARVADAVATDFDGDDLPDALEMSVFGSLEFSGTEDADADGSSNYEEWIAGTSLEDNADQFKLASAMLNSTEDVYFELRWIAQAGRSYKVYSCESLGEGAVWELVDSNAIQFAAQPHEMSWMTPYLVDDSQCFFRVVVERGDKR
jgi:hypothetical protein